MKAIDFYLSHNMSSLSCQISIIIFSTCSHYWLNCLHHGLSELLVESKHWRLEMRGNESLYFLIIFFQTFEVKTLYDNRRTENRRTERSIYFCVSLRKETDRREDICSNSGSQSVQTSVQKWKPIPPFLSIQESKRCMSLPRL